MQILLSTSTQKAVSAIIATTGTAQKLVTTSTPCQRVRVFAPGDTTNAANVYISADSTNQNWPLTPGDTVGTYIFTDDASKVFIKGTAADKVQAWIDQ